MNLLSFIRRHQSEMHYTFWIKSGLGAMLGMGFVGWLGQVSGEPFLIAPFGASCVLLFAVPTSPLAQPANMVGGHMMATIVALILRAWLPPDWWAIGLTVGLVIGLMVALRVTHPPAGATPVVIFLTDPGPMFLILPILSGCFVLVAIAWLFHKLPPYTPYPMEQKPEN